MAKSKIIQDLTNGGKLDSVLKRLYVILTDLGDKEIATWVNKELSGYNDLEEVPEYRIAYVNLMGNYQLVSYGHIQRFSNATLPTMAFDKKTLEELRQLKLLYPVATLISMINESDENKKLTIPFPVETYRAFEYGTNLEVTNAYKYLDKSELIKVVNKIESKVLDMALYLEKKFGNLDNFDIEDYDISSEDLKNIKENCKQIVYNNCNIQNFDNSKIKSKNMAVGDSKIDNRKTTTKNKNSNTGKGTNSVEKHTDIKTDVKIEKQEKEKKGNWFLNLFRKRSK